MRISRTGALGGLRQRQITVLALCAGKDIFEQSAPLLGTGRKILAGLGQIGGMGRHWDSAL
jgi:hypothetical protein